MLRLDGGPVDRDLLARMNAFQAFRGPHGGKLWTEGGVGFGHALFQLSDDDDPVAQPATLDGSAWITAHARIDGQRDLINALRGRNRTVAESASDAELILHAYAAWGERCLEHLIGDFTFALWDCRNRRLFCAVDPFGIRPFYYAVAGGTFIFSNTLACVRLHPGVSSALDETALGDFLLFNCYQDQDRTIYANLKRLPPAHCLLLSSGAPMVRRYWDFEPVTEAGSAAADEIVENFRSLLSEATRDRLRTRQIAVQLSGGLDSTSVAAAAVRLLSAGPRPWSVSAYTVVFKDLIPDDEEGFAREVAEQLGLEFNLQSGDDFEPYDWMDRCRWLPPEPINEPNWSTYLRHIGQIARHRSVLLTGIEGDFPLRASLRHHWVQLGRAGDWRRILRELTWYVTHERTVPPVGLRTAIQRLRRRPARLPPWLAPQFVRRAQLVDRLREHEAAALATPPSPDRIDRLRRVFWPGVFDSFDPAWTGCALESAHPLMDLRVMRFLLSLPPVPWCIGKRILRVAAKGILPENVLRRPKTPLAADPVLAAIQRHGLPARMLNDANGEASAYVDLSGFRAGGAVNVSVPDWSGLRPVSLACWLKSTKRPIENSLASKNPSASATRIEGKRRTCAGTVLPGAQN